MGVFVCLCTAAVYFLTDVRRYLESSAVREAAPTLSMSPDDRAVLSEILSGEQKASDGIAELNRSITAQQADLKRISDQIAALTSRIDSLPNLVLTASRPSVPSPPSAQADPKPARKLAPPPKPQGPISVGGRHWSHPRARTNLDDFPRTQSKSALHTSVADIGAA